MNCTFTLLLILKQSCKGVLILKYAILEVRNPYFLQYVVPGIEPAGILSTKCEDKCPKRGHCRIAVLNVTGKPHKQWATINEEVTAIEI